MKNFVSTYRVITLLLLPLTIFSSQTPQESVTPVTPTKVISKIIAKKYSSCMENANTPSLCLDILAKDIQYCLNGKKNSTTPQVITDPTYSPDSSS